MTSDARRLAVTLGLFGLGLYLLKDALFFGGVYASRDLLSVYIPGVEAFVRAISEGALPLRDPATAFGQPMLGNPDAQIAYPTTWLHLFMVPDQAYPLVFLFHYVLAGTGAAALAFRVRRSNWAAFFAGAFWMVGGPFQSFLSMVNHLAGAAWMPWVLTAFDRLIEKTDGRRAVVLGAVFGLQILGGSADMCAMTMALCGLRLASEARTRGQVFARLKLSLASLMIALCLGAATWLTVGEVARTSQRASLPEEVRGYWSVHPALLPELVMPLGLGSLNLVPEVNAFLFEGREPFVRSLYLGPLIVPLFLAAMFSPAVALRFRWFAGLGVFGSLLVSLGKYGSAYGLLITLAPVLRIFRYPSKAMIPASLLLCVLAGVGVTCLQDVRARRAAGVGALILALCHAVLFFRLNDVLPRLIDSRDPGVLGLAARHVGSELGLAALALLLLMVAVAFGRRGPAKAVVGLSLIVTVLMNARINETVPRTILRFRPDEVLNAVKTDKPSRVYVSDYVFSPGRSLKLLGRESPFDDTRGSGLPDTVARIVAYRSLLVPPVGAAWGVEYAWDADLRGLFHTSLREATLQMGGLEGTPFFLRLLQMANVSHVLALHDTTFGNLPLERTIRIPTPEPIYVFGVPDPLPRAYAVSGVKVSPAPTQALLDPAFRPREEVVLEAGPSREPSVAFRSRIGIVDRRADRIVLSAILNEPGSVVLLEGFLPGWEATVDGAATAVLRANAFFLAVPASAGEHRIILTYRPWTAALGGLLSGLTALVLIVVLVRPQRGIAGTAAE